MPEAEAAAETDFASNEVEVWAQSWDDGSNSSYHDEANASSPWQDELTLTSDVPGVSGSARATLRAQGSGQNLACFAVVTEEWAISPRARRSAPFRGGADRRHRRDVLDPGVRDHGHRGEPPGAGGVEVESAAGALAAYHVTAPELESEAGAAAAR